MLLLFSSLSNFSNFEFVVSSCFKFSPSRFFYQFSFLPSLKSIVFSSAIFFALSFLKTFVVAPLFSLIFSCFFWFLMVLVVRIFLVFLPSYLFFHNSHLTNFPSCTIKYYFCFVQFFISKFTSTRYVRFHHFFKNYDYVPLIIFKKFL